MEGQYKRTKRIAVRQIAARIRSAQDNHEEKGRGRMAQRPITLPPMPWDKKADEPRDLDDGK